MMVKKTWRLLSCEGASENSKFWIFFPPKKHPRISRRAPRTMGIVVVPKTWGNVGPLPNDLFLAYKLGGDPNYSIGWSSKLVIEGFSPSKCQEIISSVQGAGFWSFSSGEEHMFQTGLVQPTFRGDWFQVLQSCSNRCAKASGWTSTFGGNLTPGRFVFLGPSDGNRVGSSERNFAGKKFGWRCI